MRELGWGIAGLSLLVAMLGWLLLRRSEVAPRVYRIGWSESPPFQIAGPDGEPRGLAIERVRASSRFGSLADLALARIGMTSGKIDARMLAGYFPHALGIPRAVRPELMADLCAGRSDAAFLDAYTAISTLLEPRSCGGEGLRWIAAPALRLRFGIGAVPDARAAADALREQIGAIAIEGRMAPILGQWGFISAQQLESIEALFDAQRHARRLELTAALFALLFVIAYWQSRRMVRQRDRTRQTELALREAEQKLRLLTNNMKEMVLAYDMEGHLIFANPAIETLTGYCGAQLQRGFIDWIHPEDHARMLARWEELFQGGSFEEEEYRLISRDGRTKWASATWGPMLDSAGHQTGVQGCERDVTERKEAGEALRQSERRLRGLLENVKLGATMYDLDGACIFVNEYALQLTGWPRGEVIGSHITRFLPSDQHARIAQLLQSIKATGEPSHWFSETPFLTRDGKPCWLQIHSVVLRDAGGKVSAVAALGVDVTAHRLLQEQYLQSQKLESLGTLAGGVAHDFNNLLTVINDYSAILLRGLAASDHMRPKVDQICRAGARAAEFTQQLLAFGRRQIAQPRAVEINGLIDASSAMFRTLLGEDIELVTAPGAALGSVMADPGQLEQVLMNLLANARDAMPDGGRLAIETSAVTIPPNHAGDAPDIQAGDYVLVTVSDSGIGMDEATQRHVFEPFFTTKEPGKGTGLGLSTVYGIVKQTGGWIRVTSATGEGATFQLYLPRTAGEIEERDEETVALACTGHNETVLVVEDEPEVRQLARTVLESLGYTVLVAGDGAEALALASTHERRIHLALTDVILPGMNGKQFAGHLRGVRPDTRVLFTSGYSRNVIAHRGVLDAGVAYIAKPYAPGDLAAMVREILTG